MNAMGRRAFIGGVGLSTSAALGSVVSNMAAGAPAPMTVSPSDDADVASLVNTDGSATAKAVIKRSGQPIRTVNVRDYGAVPANQNGGAGANAGIQAAIDDMAAKGGGEVVVDDDYWIKCDVPGVGGNSLLDQGGIAMKDGIHLRFTANGVFRVIPTGESKYQCIRIYDKKKVRVSGPGRIIGERTAHVPADPNKVGEWGYGISIQGGSEIRIEDVTVTDMWGDGIDVNFVTKNGAGIPAKNVTIRNVICDGNRRQGLSIECVDWILVEDSRFVNTGGTGGTLPMNGIDVEPSSDTLQCSNVTIRRCWMQNNSGFGIGVYMLGTRDVTVDDCDFVSNLGEHQFVCNLAGPNVRLTRSRFSGTKTQCVQMAGGVVRVVADNVFDSKVRVAWNTKASVAQHVDIARNRFVTDSAARIDGLVEINEHAIHTNVVDNYFENRNVVGTGIWIRAIGEGGPRLKHIKATGNTFIRMSSAVVAGNVEQLEFSQNRIHASASEAIRLLPAFGAKIQDNRITGSNLVTGTRAIQLAANTADTLVTNNLVEIEPAVTVPETRRGTKVFDLAWGPTTNTVVRGTMVVGALDLYDQAPSPHPGTYLETTPGSWHS